MKRIVYHDTDLDGFSAAAVLLHKYPDIEFIAFPHERNTQPQTVAGYDEVYVVDTSGTLEFMEALKHNNGRLIWIDHHESPTRNLPDYEGLRRFDASAAYLTWEYILGDIPVHPVIAHVSDFDIWDFKLPQTKEFILYLETVLEEDRQIQNIERLLHTTPEQMQQYYGQGSLLSKALDKQLAYDIQLSSKGTFDGHPCRYFFYGGMHRSLFAQKAMDQYQDTDLFVMICIQETPQGKREFKYSLRSRTDAIDCTVIAAKHGGGGHTKAAGINIEELILT